MEKAWIWDGLWVNCYIYEEYIRNASGDVRHIQVRDVNMHVLLYVSEAMLLTKDVNDLQ